MGDPGSIPGSGRSPGEGNGNPLQFYCLKNPWTGQPGRLQSMGLQRVGHDWATSLSLSHTSKVMLKILQVRLQQYMNIELPDVQLDLEKAEEPEIKLLTSIGSSKKQESSRKTFTSALPTMPKLLTVWITTDYGNFFKRWEYQTTWSASWEICMQVKKQQLELDKWDNRLVPNQERCQGCVLSYMQNTSWDMLSLWSTS